MKLCQWIAVFAVTGIAGPAFGQYCAPSDPNYNYCVQQEQWRKDEEQRKKEAEEAEAQRQRDEESAAELRRTEPQRREQARQQAETEAAIQELRTRLLATAPLPPDRNPLLGRWRVTTSVMGGGGDDMSQLLGMLSNMGGAVCEVVFGEGITEFLPGSWSAIDGSGDDSLGPIQYRMEDGRAFALPDQGVPLLGFDVVDGNRIREFRLQDCELVRVDAPPVPVGSTAPGSGSSALPPSAGSVSPPPTRPAPEVCRQTLLDQLGTSRVEQARQVIGRRFKETIDGKVPNQPDGLRIDARGSECDDARVNASLYDFDANGVLQAITYVWARPPGPPPAPIFSERVATLSRFHALPPPQSPGRLQADTSLGRLVLEDLPERNLLLEAYSAGK